MTNVTKDCRGLENRKIEAMNSDVAAPKAFNWGILKISVKTWHSREVGQRVIGCSSLINSIFVLFLVYTDI